MKKILFVINTMGRAGAETALIELMRRLQQTGNYDLSLYAIIPRGELFEQVPSGIHILNQTYDTASVLSTEARRDIAAQAIRCALRRGYIFRHMGDVIRNIRSQKQRTGRVQLDKVLWRILSDGTPVPHETYDLAIAYLEGASTYFVADHVSAHAKAAFIHIDYQQAGYSPDMDNGCFDRIDRIFTVSDNVRERFCEVYPQYAAKAFLFRNLLNREAILQKSQQAGFNDDFHGIRLVTVGRLHYQKAYDIAIEACAKLVADGYPIRWYVFGEGAERSALEKQIQESGMREHFILCGAVSNPYPFIRQADVYVHATRYEGKSIAIEEAQILHRVIVASDCTGNREQIVNGVDGILFPLSVDALCSALKLVLDDPQLRQQLSNNLMHKQLEHPEDMGNLLSLLTETSAKG